MTRAWPWIPTACLLAVACGILGAGSPTADLGAAPPQPSDSESAAPSVALASPRPVSSPVPQSPARTYSNRIKWKTASELNNFGYDVYRGESPDGPFERINPEVIEGAGTTDEPTAYEYIDRTIDPRKIYYYYVESISMNGVRKRFTPLGKAGPKIPDQGSESLEESDVGAPDGNG